MRRGRRIDGGDGRRFWQRDRDDSPVALGSNEQDEPLGECLRRRRLEIRATDHPSAIGLPDDVAGLQR
jgi:hypothetical protein